MKSPRYSLRCLAWWLAVFLTVLAADSAPAHPMLQNAMWIEIGPAKIAVRMEVSVRELCVVQGLPITLDGTVDEALAEDTAPRHAPYVLDHLEFQGDGKILSGKVVGIDPPSHVKQGGEGTDKSYFIYRLEYPLPAPAPGRFTLTQTMVKEFPSAPGVPWDLSYAFRCGTPAEPMKNYGVLPRDSRISFKADGSMATEEAGGRENPEALPPAQAGLMALWGALGLNTASRRDALRVALLALGTFAAGCALGTVGGFQGTVWILAGLAGVGVLLTSVDNIHRPGVPADRLRFILTAVFSLAAGLGGAHLAGLAAAGNGLSAVSPVKTVMNFALPAAVVFILASTVMLRLEKTLSPGGVRAVRQLLSLGCAVVGLLVLFRGLGINPGGYWVSRLSGQGR